MLPSPFLILSLSLIIFSCASAKSETNITCGSVVKLRNPRIQVRLHSHDVRYGGGSTQQSVTGQSRAEDSNSYWRVTVPPNQLCIRGEPLNCGQLIRLEHLKTTCLLHSHLYSSPLTQQQEVSCFGRDGIGDTGDIWLVYCSAKGSWTKDMEISLKHRDTGMWLATNEAKFGPPIQGQHEICAVKQRSWQTTWQANEGIILLRSNLPANSPTHSEDELD